MKVLSEGKWNMIWSMEAMCSEKECGAKLLVEEGDVKSVYDSWPAKYSAVCAVCGSELSVPAPAVPLRVKAAADKKKKWASSSWD